MVTTFTSVTHLLVLRCSSWPCAFFLSLCRFQPYAAKPRTSLVSSAAQQQWSSPTDFPTQPSLPPPTTTPPTHPTHPGCTLSFLPQQSSHMEARFSVTLPGRSPLCCAPPPPPPPRRRKNESSRAAGRHAPPLERPRLLPSLHAAAFKLPATAPTGEEIWGSGLLVNDTTVNEGSVLFLASRPVMWVAASRARDPGVLHCGDWIRPPHLVLGKNEVEARQAEDPLSDSGVSFLATFCRACSTARGFILIRFLLERSLLILLVVSGNPRLDVNKARSCVEGCVVVDCVRSYS